MWAAHPGSAQARKGQDPARRAARDRLVPSPGRHEAPGAPGAQQELCPAPFCSCSDCPPGTSLCSKHGLSVLAGFSHSRSPRVSLCSPFPSTTSQAILNYSSNRALALFPGEPLCSHRSCCTEDGIVLLSSLHFPPVKLTVGL